VERSISIFENLIDTNAIKVGGARQGYATINTRIVTSN